MINDVWCILDLWLNGFGMVISESGQRYKSIRFAKALYPLLEMLEVTVLPFKKLAYKKEIA